MAVSDLSVIAHQQGALILLASVVVILSFLFQRLWRSSSREALSSPSPLPVPPGRLGLPFFGETLQFLNYKRLNLPWKFFEERVAMYGEIFKTHLIGEPTVILSNPEGNRLIFTSENKLCHVAWPSSVINVLGKRALISLQWNEAKSLRAAMMTFLRPEALRAYTGKTDEKVRTFLEEHWQGKPVVKVYPLMKRFIFHLVSGLFVSRNNKEEQEMLETLFTKMVENSFRLPIRLPGTAYSKAIAAANMIRSHFQPWIEERRRILALGKGPNDEDMLSCLLTFVHENGKQLSDEDIKDNILLLLFAGHDTSNIAITMTCRYLALHPNILEAVYRENKEILDEKGADEPLTWAHLQKMKLSWRVVQETMRLQAPVQGSFRTALQDFEYNGFRIPKGWKLFWSVHSTHLNPKYFEKPHEFDPSRFERAGPVPYSFIPFGGGPRMCPGNEFARMVIMILLHHIVIRFSWTLADPHEVITMKTMLFPTQGLPINLIPRNA